MAIAVKTSKTKFRGIAYFVRTSIQGKYLSIADLSPKQKEHYTETNCANFHNKTRNELMDREQGPFLVPCCYIFNFSFSSTQRGEKGPL